DVEGMLAYFTDDLEFYHDKGGITQGKEAFRQSLAKGLCGNENFRLRREAVKGTVNVFPMMKGDTTYGAIISGEHVFYVLEKGKKEFLDGHARFAQLWLLKDGEWRMSRILSYDHKPATYTNQRKEITLQPALLKLYVGEYRGAKTGSSIVEVEKNQLVVISGNKRFILYPETKQRFFVKDRDLTFEFIKASKGQPAKMTIQERGEVVDETVLVK
ncbi:MAG TPA: DUF4440 domain-containing protein, partial [Flavipsychrobacter sp.]|nr:DUF4440 domain-containing protein [Flavipsychrobacter sp.]